MTNVKSFGLGAFTAIALLSTAAFQFSAESAAEAGLADFVITVERSEDGIRMTCTKGCAWTELTWTSPVDNPQVVDEYGMTGEGGE